MEFSIIPKLPYSLAYPFDVNKTMLIVLIKQTVGGLDEWGRGIDLYWGVVWVFSYIFIVVLFHFFVLS